MSDVTTEIVYVDRNGDPYGEDKQQRIARWHFELTEGVVFHRHAESERSRFGYQPPTTRQQWAAAVTGVADMAYRSDALAQAASVILGPVPNLYGTDGQLYAGLWARAAKAIDDGFDDVLARTGPEPVRHSDARRRFTDRECMTIYRTLHAITEPVYGLGWCAAAVDRTLASGCNAWQGSR